MTITSSDLAHARAHRLAGDNAGALELLGHPPDNEPPDVAVERGLANFELGFWPGVIWALRPLPEDYLEQPLIAARLGDALSSLGRFDEALEVCARVHHPGLAAMAAEYAIITCDRERAQVQIERVRELDPTYPRIPELEEAAANIDEELAAVRAAWNKDQKSPSALRAVCRALFDRDKIPHAFELARIAVAKAEQLPDVWRVFVDFMHEAGLSTKERVAIIRPVALSQIAIGMPSDGEQLSQMANAPQMLPVEAYALLRKGRDEEARKLAQGVDDPLARYVVGWAKARAGEGTAALEAMLESESDEWIIGLVWLALAVTHYNAERHRAALEHANRAIEILSNEKRTAPTDIGRAYLIAAASCGDLDDALGMRTAARRGLAVVGKLQPCKELRILFNNSFCR